MSTRYESNKAPLFKVQAELVKTGAPYTIDSSSRASRACKRGLHSETRDLNIDMMLASSGCIMQIKSMSNAAIVDAATSAANLLMLWDATKMNWAVRRPTPHR